MDFCKPLAIVLLVSIGNPAVAAENNNPFQGALMLTSVAPFVITSGATAGTSYIPELSNPPKVTRWRSLAPMVRSGVHSSSRHAGFTARPTSRH